MKRKAFLLAVIACFFIFQPGFTSPQPGRCSDDGCPMQKGCAAEKHCEKKKPKDNCNSNGCNPFMACWCGNFFVIERPFASQIPITGINREFETMDEKKITGVAFECWHPPEKF